MIQKELRETAFNYIIGETTATFYTAEKKWINKITKLSKDNPNEVNIVHINEDGSILAKIPSKWFKIRVPRKLTEEQKQVIRDRFEK